MENSNQLVLQKLGIEAFNEMQIHTEKAILAHSEVVLIAPTGSGKTIAFLLPIFQLLSAKVKQVQCLVLAPTRELCLQIEQVWKKMGTGFKVNVCYGGHAMPIEIKDLSVPPALLIGTPGRIADHIRRETFDLEKINYLVLDEFDKSLELGFQEDMGFIINTIEKVEKKINIAVPKKLFGALARILVDEGKFTGQDRLTSQEIAVYDLSLDADIKRNANGIYRIDFSIYLNNRLIGKVSDNSPLQMPSSGLKTCLFTRGSTKCMFENIFALKNIKEEDVSLGERVNNTMSAESLRKYSLPSVIQNTFLSSISSETKPTVDFYFEEFGTIMRECAYFNIKYDQAYPALIAKIVPPFTVEKSYQISGFLPGSYGAEFLIFNTTDKAIDLSEKSTNRIMIQGITFTQNISNVLTVDDYFRELSNFSDPVITNNNLIVSPGRSEKIYDSVKNSRAIYGNKSFSLDSVYIQNEDSAKDIMKWILDKTIRPRKVFEIDTFATAHVQLGDIIKIDFDLPEGVKMVDENKRFVVISAQYARSSSDVKSQLRVMEV